MAKTAPTFYVFHGPDDFTRSEQLARFKAQLGAPSVVALNTTVFDGSRVTMEDIQTTCNTFPFMADRRLVIVEDLLESASGRALLEPLLDYLPTLPDWARLVLVEDKHLKDDHPLIRLANEHPGGRAIPFDAPKDATGWIIKRAGEHRASIERGAAKELAERVGHDLRLADSELAKLAVYTDGQRAISIDDLLLLTPYLAEVKVWALVDALGERNGAKASQALHRLLEDAGGRSDEIGETLGIFGMVIRQIRLLIMTRDILQAGSQADLMTSLDVKPFVAQKLTQQARNFSPDQLAVIHRHLLETDLSIKTGRMEPMLALEVLVSTLSEE